MNPEFIALTHASRSGGSYKATIPVSIVRDLWNMGDKNSVSICFFIDEGRRVFVLPLEDVLTDFPREVRERVVEEWAKQALKGFPRDSFEKLTKKLEKVLGIKIKGAVNHGEPRRVELPPATLGDVAEVRTKRG